MSQKTLKDILIRIDTIDQLFNAPAIDPFSDKPALILGEAALTNAIRQEMSRGFRTLKGRRLVIQLPSTQLGPDQQAKTIEAVRCHIAARRDDNNARVSVSRWRSLLGLAIAFVVAIVLLITVVILLNTVLASASDTAKTLLTGLAGIFIWATVWNPFDRLIYEWGGPWLENRILNSILSMDIVVQPEPAVAARTGSRG